MSLINATADCVGTVSEAIKVREQIAGSLLFFLHHV